MLSEYQDEDVKSRKDNRTCAHLVGGYATRYDDDVGVKAPTVAEGIGMLGVGFANKLYILSTLGVNGC